MAGLTGNHIEQMLRAAGAGGGLVASPDKIADLFNTAMLKYGDGLFTTDDRVAALLATCMQESAYFRTTEEYAKNGRYAPYIGRGFIQCTWRDNYAAFGKWCKAKSLLADANYFVNNPKQLADLKWAALTGVWYFTHVRFSGKPLVAYSGSIEQVSKAVNLGNPYSSSTPNGMRERREAYAAVKRYGKNIVPQPPPGRVPDAPGTKDKVVTEHVNVYPTKGSIQTPFGQWGPYWSTNKGKNPDHPNWGQHTGDDWHRGAGDKEAGDPIYAVAEGRVIYAGNGRDGLGWGADFGNQVLITWSKRVKGESFHRTSLDAHMQSIAVKYDQHVKPGDVIGYKGKTGNVSGVHDHHEQHAGQGWGDRKLRPVYPGKTITKTVETIGVPVMAKPSKFRRTKDFLVKKSKYYRSIPVTNDGKTYAVAKGPGTFYITAEITTDRDCWARFITLNKKGSKVKSSTKYDRVKIPAGGGQIVFYDTIGGPAKGYTSKIVRLQILAYSHNVKVTKSRVRAGKEA